MATDSESLEYTPTWVVAVVCSVIVIISLCVERALHHLGKYAAEATAEHVGRSASLPEDDQHNFDWLKHKQQDALFEALQKLKEELMILGFISLLLTVLQGLISDICIPKYLTVHMLPCKKEDVSSSEPVIHNYEASSPATMWNGRRLLSESTNSQHCANKGKVPLLSIEGLHQLHIFIFVLAVVHVLFCATTMFLGGAKIREWKNWENSIRGKTSESGKVTVKVDPGHAHDHLRIFKLRATGFWRKTVIISWIMSFFKQFYGSVTKSDYLAMRLGFIKEHCPANSEFDFHKYMMRTLEADFKKVVGISWYLWLFVVIFLLLNVEGWHTYFWLAFLPLIILLTVGAKLEHIITRLAIKVAESKPEDPRSSDVDPSDEHFWFGQPSIVLYLIHFLLFQNSFEIAFFFWIWSTYGFDSCIMEKLGYIIPRLIIGVIIQVLCSYSTLPLYAIVTQMGSMFKRSIFEEDVQDALGRWAHPGGGSTTVKRTKGESSSGIQMQRMAIEAFGSDQTVECPAIVLEEITTSITERSDSSQNQIGMSSS